MIRKKKLKITVTKENKTGRNIGYIVNGRHKNRPQTVKIIEQNPNKGYHNAKINGILTPKSNPDGNKKNNLG